MQRNRIEEPAVSFEVDPETRLEIYPLGARDEIKDPHDPSTWPGPGIAVLIKGPERTELRHYFTGDPGFWAFVRRAFSVVQSQLDPDERRELLKGLGEPER